MTNVIKVTEAANTTGTFNISAYGDGFGRGITVHTTQGSDTFDVDDMGAGAFNAATLVSGNPPFTTNEVHVLEVDGVSTGYNPPEEPPPSEGPIWHSIGIVPLPVARHYGTGAPVDVPDVNVGDIYIDQDNGEYFTFS